MLKNKIQKYIILLNLVQKWNNILSLQVKRWSGPQCALRNTRKIFLAKDPQNRIHSALFVVYDEKSMYNLIQGGDPELRKSGANPLAMWHSIESAQKVTKKYDFEGSMMANVEPFFRSFGAVQTPYFNIMKDNRPLLVKASLGLRVMAGSTLRRFGLR